MLPPPAFCARACHNFAVTVIGIVFFGISGRSPLFFLRIALQPDRWAGLGKLLGIRPEIPKLRNFENNASGWDYGAT